MLLSLVGCFALLPLNHAAAHNAVKAAQVEERNGSEQPHGHNLGKHILHITHLTRTSPHIISETKGAKSLPAAAPQ